MNACPSDDRLLRFLEGELLANEDAGIVAHVEGCVPCQERLERLTQGSPAAEGRSVGTVETDNDPSVGLTSTEIIDSEDGVEPVLGKPCDSERTDSEEPGASVDGGQVSGSTSDFGNAGRGGEGGSTEDASAGVPSAVDDPERTTTEAGGEPEPEPHAHGQRPTPVDWPVIAGYDILQRLGEGGMGVVYKARHLGLKRLVALKMIRGGSQARTDYLARLRVEAEAVAKTRHPNIIQIYDIGEASGLPYVALELLDGGGLDGRLAGNPQPGRQAAELMITLARAIHVAHQSRIIHRDLKPTNVLYSSDGVPKITDFGLAKQIDSDDGQTKSDQIMGSPSYMAPEQARGHSRHVGAAADVYALGAMLYEMLTGRPPFKGETPIDTIRQVIDDDPVTPSHLVPRVSRDLETICLKCLHKEPTRRYESAEALADDLGRYLGSKPIKARRIPFWERGWKWAKRRPIAAMFLLLSIAAVPLASVAIVERERQEAERQRQRVEQHRSESARILELQSEVTRELLRARQALARNDLTGARGTLAKPLETIRREPKLADLRDDAVAVLNELDQREAEQQAREADRDRYVKFLRLRDDARLHDTQFTGLELASNSDGTRRAARAALELYAATGPRAERGSPDAGRGSPDPAPGAGRGSPEPAHRPTAGLPDQERWELATLPTSLTEREREEVTEGCYELLLILSKAEPTPDQDLRRLEQASRLRPPTRAYHLRRAACLARSGDATAADRERQAANRLEPVTAFDHFLAGHERFSRKDYSGARQEFDRTLEHQPDHFWAQALFAVCTLKLGQPVEAKAYLNACLYRKRDYAWLYILRGFASSQIAAITRDVLERRPGPREAVSPVDSLFVSADSDYRRAQQLIDLGSNDELRYSVLVDRGVLRLQLRRDLDEAVGQLRAAIRLNPRGVEAFAALARVYQVQGKPDEAVEQFSRAIAAVEESGRPIAPSPLTAVLYRDRAGVEMSREQPTPAQRSRVLSDLERAIHLEMPRSPFLARDHLIRARLLTMDHREVEALAECDEAIKVVRDDRDAHELRIELLLGAKKLDDVIRSCDAFVKRGNASAAIYTLRALAREEIRDLPGAIEDFSSAMALGGDRAALLRQRGWLYIVADSPRLALYDFEAAILLNRSNGDALVGRGLARLRLLEYREGVADAEKALSLGEPSSNLLYKAARVYAFASVVVAAEARKKGQEAVDLVARYQDNAVALLRQALKKMPENQRAAFWRDAQAADPAVRALRRRLSATDFGEPVASAAAKPAVPAPGSSRP